MIGTKLAHYEITSHLGTGGMGDVYQATDSKLGRSVAIKILPAAFASDPERLSRFRREAQVLASLNHPNIAHVYGLEESGETRCIVMELVEGETLQARIKQGPVSVEEALTIAKQITEALEAAHERGIIHRDLKPGNVMLTADGNVKVLDFGLAKAHDVSPSSADLSNSPTMVSITATNAGVILGTVAYMAPEQARGKAVDKRADIFAFGVVLYEMLTGTRAFEDEDVSMTLSKVLQREPDFDALPPTVPPRVRQALRLCLRKDPKQRVADIRDVRLALEGAFETVAPETATTTSSASGGRLAWIAFAVAAVVIVVMAAPTLRHLQETPSPGPPETRLEIVTPRTDRPESFALSPDGRQIVFAASGEGASRLWLRPLATTNAQPLQGTDGARLPFWSPDGRSIGFFADTALKRFDLGGGAPQTLAVIAAGQGGTWNTDGVIVFAPSTTSALLRVSASGGTPVAVTQLDPRQQGHVSPYFLPDGRRFLFEVRGAPDTAGVYMGALDGNARTRLTPGGSPTFLPSGWLLWVRAGRLLAQRLDVSKAALIGEPVTLADGVGAVSIAAAGPVAYRKTGGSQQQLTWFDRSGTARGTVGDPDASLPNPRVSPDGRRVVVSRTVQGNQDLWLLDGARVSRFTFDPANDRFPVWSPDGARIVFHSTRTGGGDLYVKLASGAGAEERLAAPEQFKLATSWSADGRFLLYQRTDPQTSSDLWVAEMVGDYKSSVILQTPFAERFGMFSPDGRLFAYQSNESGRNEIYVRPFVPPGAASANEAAGAQWQVSTAGGIMPAWRADGKELYYLSPAGAMMAAPITITGAAVAPGAPTMLFPTRIYGGGVDNQQAQQYDVARDGRFLINTSLDSAAAPITLLQNWKPASK